MCVFGTQQVQDVVTYMPAILNGACFTNHPEYWGADKAAYDSEVSTLISNWVGYMKASSNCFTLWTQISTSMFLFY